MEQITFHPVFEDWQRAARGALQRELAPGNVVWQELSAAQPGLDLFDEAVEQGTPGAAPMIRVPRSFVELARTVALHREESRWALLYRIVWRITHGEPRLLEIPVDADITRAFEFQKAVRHDVHKMRAFVRFREIERGGEKWFVAWFEPEHHIVEYNARFFVERFASMRWSILTPDRCAHWDGAELRFTGAIKKSAAPRADDLEALWLTYYSNIFNPARVKVHAMQAEMPKKYWRNLPEAVVIPSLLQEAPRRVEAMTRKSAEKAQPNEETNWRPAPVPETTDLRKVAAAARACTACHLYKRGTQTVFGEGPNARSCCPWGNSPATRKISRGGHSSVPPASSSTARWKKRAFRGTASTSRIR